MTISFWGYCVKTPTICPNRDRSFDNALFGLWVRPISGLLNPRRERGASTQHDPAAGAGKFCALRDHWSDPGIASQVGLGSATPVWKLTSCQTREPEQTKANDGRYFGQ